MSKSTPGPWKLSVSNMTVITDADGESLASVCSPFSRIMSKQEFTANARLIAAAPELLEAAKEAVEFLVANGMAHGKKLQEAIDKAEGK